MKGAAAVDRRVVIKLFDKAINKSPTGFETRNTTTGREVIAKQGGVGRSEFYKAAAAGMTPAVVFTVSEADYDDERMIEFDGKVFRLIRSYPVANRKIELVCEGVEPNDD